MSNKAHELVCRDVTEITKSDMVFNFGMLNNSAFKKAINNFGKFYSLKNIDRNIKICLTLCHRHMYGWFDNFTV